MALPRRSPDGAPRRAAGAGACRLALRAVLLWQVLAVLQSPAACHDGRKQAARTLQACNTTVWDALMEAPDSAFASLLDLRGSAYEMQQYLDDPANKVTLFAPTERGLLQTLQALRELGADSQAITELLDASGPLLNSVALYNLLPEGPHSPAALLAERSVPTALAAVTLANYSLGFVEGPGGEVEVLSLAPYNVTIVASVPACNGWLHMTDRLLFPGEQLDKRDLLLVDEPWPRIAELAQERLCNGTLLDEALASPELQPHVAALLEFMPQMQRLLDREGLAGTLLLPTEQAVDHMRDIYGAAYGRSANVTELLLYSLLPEVYCPIDLAAAGSAQTALGEASGGANIPLGFKLAQGDTRLTVSGFAPNLWNGTVHSSRALCTVEVLLYDGVPRTDALPPGGYKDVPRPPQRALADRQATGSGGESRAPHCVYPLSPDVVAGLTSSGGNSSAGAGKGSADDSGSSDDGGGLSVGAALAISIPCTFVGTLLLVGLLAAAGGAAMRRRRERLGLEASYAGGGGGKGGMQGGGDGGGSGEDDSVATEDLMAAIARAASGGGREFDRAASWRQRNQALSIYERPAGGLYKSKAANGQCGSDATPSSPSFSPMPSWAVRERDRDREGWHLHPEELTFVTHRNGERWRLGSGGCAEVYRGLRGGVQDVAIKVLPSSADKAPEARAAQRARLTREIQVLKDCRDRNIVQFYGACFQEDGNVMLVTEYMAGGDLFQALRAERKAAMEARPGSPPPRRRFAWHEHGQHVALDIARALCYMHARHIVHMDVKSPNVLLAPDGTAKLADLGLAQAIQSGPSDVPEEQGTYVWAAPEVLMNMRPTEKADMFSFGVILHELATGEEPKRGRLRSLHAPSDCPEDIADLIAACLQVVSAERPTALQAYHVIQGAIARAERENGGARAARGGGGSGSGSGSGARPA